MARARKNKDKTGIYIRDIDTRMDWFIRRVAAEKRINRKDEAVKYILQKAMEKGV